jgi:hypothetical protein
MNRCEAISHVQKAKELPAGRPDLHIPQELGEACSSRIGLTRAINSHPTHTILYNYSHVKEKVKRYRSSLKMSPRFAH